MVGRRGARRYVRRASRKGGGGLKRVYGADAVHQEIRGVGLRVLHHSRLSAKVPNPSRPPPECEQVTHLCKHRAYAPQELRLARGPSPQGEETDVARLQVMYPCSERPQPYSRVLLTISLACRALRPSAPLYLIPSLTFPRT